MPDKPMEIKAGSLTQFKAKGDAGEYEGYFSVIGNIDDGGDIIEPGSFKKTIAERGGRVKVFFAHDWTRPIGPPPSSLLEDSMGLYAAGRLTLGSFWGREVWELMKDAALTEGSIGYTPIKYDWSDEGRVRHIRELKLYEISPVPLGMNPLTSIRSVKAALPFAADPSTVAPVLESVIDLLGDPKFAGINLKASSDARFALEKIVEHLYYKTEGAAAQPDGATRSLALRLRLAEVALKVQNFQAN